MIEQQRTGAVGFERRIEAGDVAVGAVAVRELADESAWFSAAAEYVDAQQTGARQLPCRLAEKRLATGQHSGFPLRAPTRGMEFEQLVEKLAVGIVPNSLEVGVALGAQAFAVTP